MYIILTMETKNTYVLIVGVECDHNTHTSDIDTNYEGYLFALTLKRRSMDMQQVAQFLTTFEWFIDAKQ